MSIKALFEAFEEIETTSGKLNKLVLLEKLKAGPQNELAKEYFSIAMDWYRIFNVGEKSLDPDVDLDHEVFGASPKTKQAGRSADVYWDTFLKLIGRIERGGFEKPAKEEVRAFVNFVQDPQSNKWIMAALLKKPRMGVSEKTVNKVWPKLINYFEVQLADVLEKADDLVFGNGDGLDKKKAKAARSYFYLEPKLDGIRAVCRINPDTGTVKFLSRGGQVLNNTGPAGINKVLLDTCNGEMVFDGELFGVNWNETTRVTSKGEGEADTALVSKLRFFIFDAMTAQEWDEQKCERDYNNRRELITFPCMNQSADKVVKTISHAVENAEQVDKLFTQYLQQGYEGVMVKDPHGLYTFSRNNAWRKFKPLSTDEFEIISVFEGTKKSKNEGKAGGLILKIKDGITCQVGSGFSDAQREAFWNSPPVGQIAEVEFKEKTPDGLLREPVFVRIRDDKRKSDD